MIDLELSADKAGLILVEAARRFGMPVLISEQYPKGLGHTEPEIARALETVRDVARFEKVQFGCGGLPEFDAQAAKRKQWIACGMETHVCLYQTARSLARTHTVFVPADAALSRTKANWKIGMDLIAQSGCVVTSTETVAFDLLKRAGTDDFKALSKLIK
jgi:nicotinamidase-related amidase